MNVPRKKRNIKTTFGVWKMVADSHDVVWNTNGCMRFDIKAYLKPDTQVDLYGSDNIRSMKFAREEISRKNSGILLNPGDRALIQTGLVFDIPEYHSLRIHPQFDMSWKNGITLTNCEGIIDYDYSEQLYISVINISRQRIFIGDGDRIAQCELVLSLHANNINILNLDKKPAQKKRRLPGFGHIGK